MSKHYTKLKVVCVGWSQPTALECTVAISNPLSISSYPCFGKRATVCCSALLLSLHNFLRLVALTFVVWTLHSSLKNTRQTKNQCPAWPLHFLGLPQTPMLELGFGGTISPPGLPPLQAQQLPPVLPLRTGRAQQVSMDARGSVPRASTEQMGRWL